MIHRFHTSNLRVAQQMWIAYGGSIVPILGTGEMRYVHPFFPKPLRVNNRRSDVSAKLLTRINQAAKLANESRLQALSEPDLSLSTHPVPIAHH